MANIVSPDWVIKHLAKGVAAGPSTTIPGDSANKALKTAFISKNFYNVEGVVLPEPRVAGAYLSNDGTNLHWEHVTLTPPPIDPNDEGKVVVVDNGEIKYRHLVPHPFPAGQVLFNNGTTLEWRILPEIPTVTPSDNGKITIFKNNTITWNTLSLGEAGPLPETVGNDGRFLSNNGTALNNGASLLWGGTSTTETADPPPGTIIGYADAYIGTDDLFYLETRVFPDRPSALVAHEDPGSDTFQVMRWNNSSVVTLDGGDPFGAWEGDGIFVFNRDCFIVASSTQHARLLFDQSTGYTIAGDVYLVHDVRRPGEDGYDSYIVGGRAGENFGYPYNPNIPPHVLGSFNCAISVASGDRLSVKGLFTTVGGTVAQIGYGDGISSAPARPTFGIMAMTGFPVVCPILLVADFDAVEARVTTAVYETDELAIEALADYNSDAYSAFGPCRFDLDNTRENAIRDSDYLSSMDFVMDADMKLQLAAYINVQWYGSEWVVPPEALLLYHKYDYDNDTYEAPVVLARIATVYDNSNPKDRLYRLLDTLEYTGKFWRGDRIRVVYSWVSTSSGYAYYSTCRLEVRSCTKV